MSQNILTPEQWISAKLNKADKSNDVKTKSGPDGKYIRTPWTLCEEIVSEIARTIKGVVSQDIEDLYLYQDALKGQKILVVDTVEFIPVLLAFGAEKCNITYVAPYEYKGAMIAGVIGVRVVQQSLLEWRPDMKFDVVVGNPPYQGNGNNGSHGKWQKFFQISSDLSTSTGCIALITPHWHNWACSTSEPLGIAKSGEVYERSSGKDYRIFSSGLVKKLALINRNVHFATVGSTFCWTLIVKDKKDTISEVVFEDGNTSQIDFTTEQGLPSKFNSLTLSIYRKLFRDGCFPFYMDHQTINIKAENYRENPEGDYQYKWIYSAGAEGVRFRWIKERSNNYSKYKILIPISAAGNAYRYASIQTECNQSQDLSMMMFDSAAEAQKMLSYLKIPFIDKIFRINTGTTKHGKIILPKLDLSRTWTDAELYAHFGLTQEEIDYIEVTVK